MVTTFRQKRSRDFEEMLYNSLSNGHKFGQQGS